MAPVKKLTPSERARMAGNRRRAGERAALGPWHEQLMVVVKEKHRAFFRDASATVAEGFRGRALLVGLALLFTALSAGLAFGIPSLQHVIVKTGAFAALCPPESPLPCQAQADRIALLAFVTRINALTFAAPAGALLDATGPRVTACIASLIQCFGFIAAAYGLYWPGFSALAISGPVTFMALVSTAKLFGSYSPFVITAQVAAYMASPLLFMGLNALVSPMYITLWQGFALFLIVPIALFFTSLLLFPDVPFRDCLPPEFAVAAADKGEPERLFIVRSQLIAEEVERRKDADVPSSPISIDTPLIKTEETRSAPPPAYLFNAPLRDQMRSPAMFILTFYVAVNVVHANIYVDTFKFQLIDWLGSYTWLFTLLAPCGALLAAPIAGAVLSFFGVPSGMLLQSVAALAFVCFTWATVPIKAVAFVLFGANHLLAHACTITFISEVFGFENFGRLYGLPHIFASLLVSLEALRPLALEGYPVTYWWLIFGLTSFQIIGAIVVATFIVKYLFSDFWVRPKMPSVSSER
eukprot:TRINITY_DN1618_c1_g1_i1.p1 TRINITY_DN1618_c1_g1~~TRINITY_DN1618_c1_g1_i1.p1  ORF type:complete len:525 (-),score=75.75 TRINITY_DN1618_c1_g1_i1:1497-3071(-)